MLLDKYLSYNTKIIISLITASIWIYFRTAECYALVPRKSLFSVIFITIWMYLNYKDPLFCPIGIIILVLYTKIKNIKNFDLNTPPDPKKFLSKKKMYKGKKKLKSLK